MDLKERIQLLCKQNKVSMNKLETDLEFGKGYISKLGKSTPNVTKLKKIANYFGVTMDYLIAGTTGNNVCSPCPDCGMLYDPNAPEDIKAHLKNHSNWEKAVEKFGKLYCNPTENERIKAKNRNISRDLSLSLDERIEAQIEVLRCLFSRSVDNSGYNLRHVPFNAYIAMMLGNESYRKNLDDDLFRALLNKYGTMPGINKGSRYHIPDLKAVRETQEDECDIEENTATLEEFEKLVKPYRSLDAPGKKHIDYELAREVKRSTQLLDTQAQLRDAQSENESLKLQFSQAQTISRFFAYYGRIAAAGTSVEFSDIAAGVRAYPENETNKNADYIIGVNGDSMEPEYSDGDIVYVQKTDHIETGDIGIFQKGNNIYIKKAGENGLISLNPNYPPLTADGERITVLGKVLGKAEED